MFDFGLNTPIVREFAVALRLVCYLPINIGFRIPTLAVIGASEMHPLSLFDNGTRIDVENLLFGTISMKESEASRSDFNMIETTTMIRPYRIEDALRVGRVVVIDPDRNKKSRQLVESTAF